MAPHRSTDRRLFKIFFRDVTREHCTETMKKEIMAEEKYRESRIRKTSGRDDGKTVRNTRRTGSDYERAAGYYLEQMGYEVLEYNYRCRAGEIDLIAKDGEYLVFCEVKYRSDGRKGSPLEAVGPGKQKKIFRCAMFYLAERHLENIPCRFDVIGIEGAEVTYIKNAFMG